MSLLIFGFRRTISEGIAVGLSHFGDVAVLNSSIKAIDEFVANVVDRRPKLILGLGSYSGKGAATIRIETTCSSQFRNNRANLQIKSIPSFIQPSLDFQLATSIGNSWCNLISYRITAAQPHTPFTFLHIPTTVSEEKAIRVIELQLSESCKNRGGMLP